MFAKGTIALLLSASSLTLASPFAPSPPALNARTTTDLGGLVVNFWTNSDCSGPAHGSICGDTTTASQCYDLASSNINSFSFTGGPAQGCNDTAAHSEFHWQIFPTDDCLDLAAFWSCHAAPCRACDGDCSTAPFNNNPSPQPGGDS